MKLKPVYKLICYLLLISAPIGTVGAKPEVSVACFDTSGSVKAPDKAVLARFTAVCKKMSEVPEHLTIAGAMTINDKAHHAGDMDKVPFLFCKQGKSFYYRLGTTATINEQGLYLFIDYKAKSIILSPQKPVTYDSSWKQFADLGAAIRDDHYQMTSFVQRENETITLTNEHHISCKQYAVTFNRYSMRISRLFMRLSNFDDPVRTDNEKIVDVTFSQWSGLADIGKYLSPVQIVTGTGKGWKTQKAFKQYHLIEM